MIQLPGRDQTKSELRLTALRWRFGDRFGRDEQTHHELIFNVCGDAWASSMDYEDDVNAERRRLVAKR